MLPDISIRVNGTGNAWPVPLGTVHPFYDLNDFQELANASFSIIKTGRKGIEWEVLIDAGHGIIQYLLQHNNRIPDAVILTHSHLDHTLSLDWIIQSAYKHHRKQKLFPVYTSARSWDFVSDSFPHLEPLSQYTELLPGRQITLEEAPELKLTFPVWHGKHAPGAGMLAVEYEKEGSKPVKVVFTGDILCPILRDQDYSYLTGSKYLFTDANNRFPYLRSNHWSITGADPEKKYGKNGGRGHHNGPGDNAGISDEIKEWRSSFSPSMLLEPHLSKEKENAMDPYFDKFIMQADSQIPLSVFDFARKVHFDQIMLVHYSGGEDMAYHQEAILDKNGLARWVNDQANSAGITSRFLVPSAGDIFPFWIIAATILYILYYLSNIIKNIVTRWLLKDLESHSKRTCWKSWICWLKNNGFQTVHRQSGF